MEVEYSNLIDGGPCGRQPDESCLGFMRGKQGTHGAMNGSGGLAYPKAV